MNTLVWWLIPIAATLLALLVVTLAARPRKQPDPLDTVEAYEKFRRAIAKAPHTQHRRRAAAARHDSTTVSGGVVSVERRKAS